MRKFATAIAAIALIGTPAFAADMAVKAPPPVPEPIYSWTGFYVGLNAGWSWGKENATVNFPGPGFNAIGFGIPSLSGSTSCACNLSDLGIEYQETNHSMGAIGGVQAGYNWQAASNWILGIEADFQASGENASGNTHQTATVLSEIVQGLFPNQIVLASATAGQSISQNNALLWFGTVRGRIGYAIWPNLMLYGTGGLAYGRLNESGSVSFNTSCTTVIGVGPCFGGITFLNGTSMNIPSSASHSFEAAVTKTGWTVGGGIEGTVPNTHVTWKAEYLYMDLGSQNYSFNNPFFGTILVNTHFTDNIVRVGLNYQFH
jgi:outer membrane immunogenic protein